MASRITWKFFRPRKQSQSAVRTMFKAFTHSISQKWRSPGRWALPKADSTISSEGNNMAHTIDTMQDDLRVALDVEENVIADPKLGAPPASRPTEPKQLSVPKWTFGTLGLLAVAATFSWLLHARRFESTDDAQIDGHLNAISARITGTVVRINPSVENNQYVEAGTLLLELDPNDYQASLDNATG